MFFHFSSCLRFSPPPSLPQPLSPRCPASSLACCEEGQNGRSRRTEQNAQITTHALCPLGAVGVWGRRLPRWDRASGERQRRRRPPLRMRDIDATIRSLA